MRIKVLGTAAGGGVPQWNCGCSNCAASREGKLPSRLPAAIAVCADDDRWVLVNASCEISRQLRSTPQLQPTSCRGSPIAALLLTDANVDHAAGLLEFRQAQAFSTYSSAIVQATLCANPMFGQFAQGEKRWKTFDAGGDRTRVDLSEAPKLSVTAIAVPGKLPSYAGGHIREGAATAFLFEDAGARLVYAPIFLELNASLKEELARASALFLDGTFWSDEEMITLGLGTRTSLEMGHAPINGPGGSLAMIGDARARHRFYTHVNNSNPILDPKSDQSCTLRQGGFAVAWDGLELSLDGNQPEA